MNWSPQQDKALKEVAEWLRDPNKQTLYLAGFAGTGKTTLAQYLTQDISGTVLFAAYTGKAASVLRSKGCVNASTIHSILYSVHEASRARLLEMEAELERLLKEAEEEGGELDRDRVRELRSDIRTERKRVTRPNFSLNPTSPLHEAELLVLDECSMINKPIGDDIVSFGKKVLVLGDPAQLPPIKGTGYFTSRRPDILLTEIHRQARDNPIIHISTLIRNGQPVPFGEYSPEVRKIQRTRLKDEHIATTAINHQLLTGKNLTRRNMNRRARAILGHNDEWPEKGERLVVLRNNKELDVQNGVTCEAASGVEVDEGGMHIVDLNYEGRYVPGVELEVEYLRATVEGREPDDSAVSFYNPGLPMDYGYALTVHKSQGSQWPSVTLLDDGFGKWDAGLRKSWMYTAVTRAESHLTIIS